MTGSTNIPNPIALQPGTGNFPTAQSHLRIARPVRSLSAAEKFWVQGLGLSVLFRTSGNPADVEGEHALLMLGWPGAAWHLEFIHDPEGKMIPPTTTQEEDLVVLYVEGLVDPAVVERLEVRGGGKRVTARNPYWEKWGVTIKDSDGYRLVICQQKWENKTLVE